MSHAGLLSARTTTERREVLAGTEGERDGARRGQFRGGGFGRVRRAQILACKLSNPLSDVWSCLWRARFGDAGSVGQWRGGTIAKRHVASVGNASRSLPRSNTTLRELLRAAPGSGHISRRATHLTTALLVAGVDPTPPLLLAPAPRRDAADTTGLAFTAARAITSCVIADAIVHRARSDLIRALRIAWWDSGPRL